MGLGSLDAVTDVWRMVLEGVEGWTETSAVVEKRLDSVFGVEDSADGASVTEGCEKELPVADGAGVWSGGLSSCRRTA